MTTNIAIKLHSGQAYVFGNVSMRRLVLTPNHLAIYPEDDAPGKADIWEMSDLKEILIKPMPAIHAKILAWEQSLPAAPPQPIGML